MLAVAAIATILWPAAPARGQDSWEKIYLSCPLDGTAFTSYAAMPGGSRGFDAELRPRGGADTTLAAMAYCPKCGFATEYQRFGQSDGLDAAKVRAAIAAVKAPRLFLPLERAIAVERAWTDNPATIARLAMGEKWLAETTGEPEVVRDRTERALAACKAVVAAAEAAGDDPERAGLAAPYTYLAGELHRQLGQLDQAVAWFERAAKISAGNYDSLIASRLFLARHAAAPVAQIIADARTPNPLVRIAAVQLLRGSDDPAAVDFIRDQCVGGISDRDYRGEPLAVLIGDRPRAAHLPVYLAAAASDDALIARLGAAGLERLGDRKAAPALIEAIGARWKKLNPEPPQFLDPYVPYQLAPLFAALSATAGEQDAGAVAGLLDLDRKFFPKDLVVGSLAATRSPAAVAPIVAAIKQAGGRAFGRNEHALAAMGPASATLLEQLGDLKSAGGDDPLAVAKVRVLACSNAPDAIGQLAAAFGREMPLKLEAAVALAAHGDARGRELIVENFLKLRSGEEGPAGFPPADPTVVLPLLKPADFEPLTAQYGTVLENCQQVHTRKANCRPEYGPFDPANEPEAMAWMPILAATRNGEARTILLEAWPNLHGFQHFMVEGLGWFYGSDAKATDLIVTNFLTLDGDSQAAAMAAFARAKDAARAPLLLELATQPTTVTVKLAWIDAMGKLAPAQAVPFLKRWADSPNAELSAAAKAALAPAGEPTAWSVHRSRAVTLN